MRAAIPLFAVLAACAGPPVAEEKDDPAALVELLGHVHPLRREEAAYRLSILGQTIPGKIARAEEDTASLRQGISLALEERDPQRLVWRAYHALRLGLLARDWDGVSEALSIQGFRLVEIYEPHERSKFVRFLAQPAAYVNGAGDRHDLFFWVQSIRQDSSWTVREVYVGLHVKFEALFKQLSATERYPRDSVLGRFFGLPEVQRMSIVFPLLEEIELTYGRIRLKDSDGAAAGFHVNAGFVMDGKAGGRAMTCTAESGLDPRETRRGKLAWEGYSASDRVGPLVLRGGGFWGAGAPRPQED